MESRVFYCKKAECKTLFQNQSSHDEHARELVEIPPFLIRKFQFNRKLGQGSFATVFEVKENFDQKIKALKLMKDVDSEENIEISILSDIHYQYLIRYFYSNRVEEISNTYIVMEMCDYDLEGYIRQKNPSINDKLDIFMQICKAVNYLHCKCEKTIIHRDLKPSNILIKGNQVRISDFGVSKLTESMQNATKTMVIGTKFYLSPELLQFEENNEYVSTSTKQDIWALGIILHQMLAQFKHPFRHSREWIRNVIMGIYQIDTEFIKEGTNLYKIIEGCLQTNPEERFSIKDVLNLLKKEKSSKIFSTEYPQSERFSLPSNIFSNEVSSLNSQGNAFIKNQTSTKSNMPSYDGVFEQCGSQLGKKKGDFIDKEAKFQKDIKMVNDFITKKEIKEACRLIEMILSYNAECKEAKILYIECLAKLGNIEKANQIFDEICSEIKNSIEFYFLKGIIYNYNNELTKAQQMFGEAMKLDPSNSQSMQAFENCRKIENLKIKGNQAFKSENYIEAIDFYSQAMNIDPFNKKFVAMILSNIAFALMNLNYFEKALEACNFSLDNDNKFIKSYLRRAEIFMKLKRFKEAIEDYQKITQLEPSLSQEVEEKIKIVQSYLD